VQPRLRAAAAELAAVAAPRGAAVMAHLLLGARPWFTGEKSAALGRSCDRFRTAIGEWRVNHKYTIEALRGLVSVRRDSEQALRMCAASLPAGPLEALCLRSAAECVAAIRELEGLIELLGGGRQPHGAVAGFWRSGWAGLRAALACAEDGAILDACERGESWILEAYRNALDDHLPDFVRNAVLRQFEVLMSTHDAIRGCRVQRAVRGDTAAPGAQASRQ